MITITLTPAQLAEIDRARFISCCRQNLLTHRKVALRFFRSRMNAGASFDEAWEDYLPEYRPMQSSTQY